MPVPGDDVAGLEPLTSIPGESPEDREARMLAHIGRHLTGRDLALRTELRYEIARLAENGVRMDHAISDLDARLGAEVRHRTDEDRRIDATVRDIPDRIMDLQKAMLDTKSELITAIQGRAPIQSGPSSAPSPTETSPTLGTLVLRSKPMQALVTAMAVLLVAVAVAVLAMALGPERAADVASSAVDKLPRYEIRATAEPAPIDAPAPGEPPAPAP